MSSSDTSSINDLVARRTDKDYGTMRLVTIPDFPNLSESKQAKILARLRQLEDSPSVDALALSARLNQLFPTHGVDTSLSGSSPSTAPTTPPPDREEEMEQDRLMEEQACQRLEQDGCPPCYPAKLSLLAPDPPEQHRGIISFWEEAFPSTESGALCGQWKDWEAFREFQAENRRYYLERKCLADFTKAAYERRRRHHLGGEVCLHSDPGKQSRSENWIEFQDYHLLIHDGLEKKVWTEGENLDTARKKLEDVDTSEVVLVKMWVEAYEKRLASARSKAKLHEQILLPWIEQQRVAMVAARSAFGDDTGYYDDQADAIRRSPAPSCQRRRKTKSHSILSSIQSGVRKSAIRKRGLRRQRPEVSQEAEKAPSDSDFSQSDILQMSQMPSSRANKTRRANEDMYIGPFRPLKATKTVKKGAKTKRPAGTNTTLRPTSTIGRTRQRNPIQRARSIRRKTTQPSPQTVFKTRSGRESRIPERPGFVSD